MVEAIGRARALYETAHAADNAGRFSDALDGYRTVAELVDAAALDGLPRDGSALLVRAWLGQARCLYELHGDKPAAFALLDAAEARCVRDGLADDLLAAQGQRGLLLLRAGDLDAAIVALDKVAPGADAELTLDLGIVMLNRGALHLEAGDPDAAEPDLLLAAEVAEKTGYAPLLAAARHNLGCAAFRKGDLPRALREMGQVAGDLDQAVTALDRGRVLADAGLVTDAAAALAEAATLAGSEAALTAAEAQLELARCLLDLRRHDEAAQAAERAARTFERAENPGWAARARVMVLEAELAADRFTRTRAPAETLRDRAARALELAASGESGGLIGRLMVVYPSLLAAAEWSVLAGDLDAARDHLSHVPANLDMAPLTLRLARSAVVASVAFAEGRRSAGLRAIRHGQTVLAEHRGLGSVEAVAASGVHFMHLNLVDTQAALDTGDAGALFDALERGRAAAAGAARLVPPDDAVLAGLLEQARAEHQASLALGPTADPDGLRRKRQHLVQARRYEAEARERSWQIEGERRPVEPATARAVRAALRDAAADRHPVVVSYVTMAGRAMAVRVDASGPTLHELAHRGEVMELARRTRADLAVLANPLIPGTLSDAAGASLGRTLARLDELLLAPLAVDGDLHVVARGRLLTLPWSALPSRAGLRTWVRDRADLSPGLVAAGAARSGGVVVVAGPGTDGGSDEAEAVARVWPRATLLTGAGATTAATAEALHDAAVVHIAAHGGHAADNAMFSTLRLADGPLFAHELDGIDLTGAVVVLSACDLGQSTSDVGGEELGFASVLLRHGASAVIAAVAPLRDDVAVRVMPRLHEGLRDGLPPGSALAAATSGETVPVPLVCFGPLVV